MERKRVCLVEEKASFAPPAGRSPANRSNRGLWRKTEDDDFDPPEFGEPLLEALDRGSRAGDDAYRR